MLVVDRLGSVNEVCCSTGSSVFKASMFMNSDSIFDISFNT